MNKNLSTAYLILIIAFAVFSCGGPAKEKKNASTSSLSLHAGDKKYYTVDKKESEIKWMGSSVEGSHEGYTYVSQGELLIENDQLLGGTVEIDMVKTEGPGHDKTNNLIDHLKSPDFFDVTKFPFSKMVITQVAATNGDNRTVTGDLTIKGITHPVTFPAKVEIKNGIARADARLIIDRTNWGVRYNSGKFYDNLADKAISDSVVFHIRIVAKKIGLLKH